MSLGPALKKMDSLWDAFLAMFDSQVNDKPPRYLEEFFKAPESRIVVTFLINAFALFEIPLLRLQVILMRMHYLCHLLQETKALLPEMIEILTTLKAILSERKEQRYYGARTEGLLQRLDDQRVAEFLRMSFDDYYKLCLQYINDWFRLDRLPTNINWIMIKGGKKTSFKEVQALATQIAPELDEDSLFNEVALLNIAWMKITEETVEPVDQKWQKIFKDNKDALPGLYRLVSSILSIPISNAFVERVFSLCGAQWTNDRNSLQVETVKSLLQVKVNLDETCAEMHALLLMDEKLSKKIRGAEKYA